MSTVIKRLLKMRRLARATQGYDRARYRARHAGEHAEIVTLHHPVPIDGAEKDLAGAQVDISLSNVLDTPIEPMASPTWMEAYWKIIDVLNADLKRLTAVPPRHLIDQARFPDGSPADADLVRPKGQTATEILERAKAAADRDRREALRRERWKILKVELERSSITLPRKFSVDPEDYKFVDGTRRIHFGLLPYGTD